MQVCCSGRIFWRCDHSPHHLLNHLSLIPPSLHSPLPHATFCLRGPLTNSRQRSRVMHVSREREKILACVCVSAMDAARQLQEASPGRGGPDRPGHGMHAERVSYIISSMPPCTYVSQQCAWLQLSASACEEEKKKKLDHVLLNSDDLCVCFCTRGEEEISILCLSLRP
jgi:hypothetical protein